MKKMTKLHLAVQTTKRQRREKNGKWLSLYEGLFTRQSRMNCSENDLASVSFAYSQTVHVNGLE
jgi:hypothetical protein